MKDWLKILLCVAVIAVAITIHNWNKHNDVDPMTAMHPDYCGYIGLIGVLCFMWLTWKKVSR